MMKKIYTLILLTGFAIYSNAQNGNVAINKNSADAALDIKSIHLTKESIADKTKNESDKVLRFSTVTTEIEKEENPDFVFFVGKKNEDATNGNSYDLRKIEATEVFNTIPKTKLVEKVIERITPLKKLVTRSTAKKNAFNETTITLDNQVINTSEKDFVFNQTGNYIEFKKAGKYNVAAWIGFEKLTSYTGDVILSVSKYDGISAYQALKNYTITRTKNGSEYGNSTGTNAVITQSIGGSFSFTYDFVKGDKIQLNVDTKGRTLTIAPGAMLSVSGVATDTPTEQPAGGSTTAPSN